MGRFGVYLSGGLLAGLLLLAGLPAAAQTTGRNPSHADILKGFDAAAFWASPEDIDYGGTYNPTGLVIKWHRPIRWRVEGFQHNKTAIATATGALARMAEIAGLQQREAKEGEEANFIFVFRDVANFLLNGRRASCYMTPSYNSTTGHMTKAVLQVNLSAGGLDRCIVHETLHGFGLLNHPHKLHSVLSYYTSNFVYDLTEPDIVMLQTLYDPRMKSPVSRLTGLMLADGIIEEKRRALNPAAPPKTDSTGIFQAVIADLEKVAAAGNGRAAVYLAEAYRFGLAVPQDEAKMWAVIDRAAQIPDAAARFDVAYALAGGRYVAQDETRAAAIYRRLAEGGHVVAQNNLAVLLQDGKGVPEDKTEALMWFTIAAGKDFKLAETNRQKLLPKLPAEMQTTAAQRAAAWKPAP
jgi:hypothetical protein